MVLEWGLDQGLCILGKYSDFALYPQLISLVPVLERETQESWELPPFQSRTSDPALGAPGSVYTEAGQSHGPPKVL